MAPAAQHPSEWVGVRDAQGNGKTSGNAGVEQGFEATTQFLSYFDIDASDLPAFPAGNALVLRPAHPFASGAVYTGQWRGPHRHGFGRQMWQDGALYEGEWKDNQADGAGRF